MKHTISGRGFHGEFNVSFISENDEPFLMSKAQRARYIKAICGVSGCNCPEPKLDADSATVISANMLPHRAMMEIGVIKHDWDSLILFPAGSELPEID